MLLSPLTNISLAQSKQALSVLFYLLVFLLAGPFTLTALLYMLLNTQFWWISVAYATWWIWDVQTCNTGGRNQNSFLVKWVRGWTLWKHYRDYFPMKLVKTAPLDPTKNHLICCHPHGILCFGAACCFASEAEDFSKRFPGIFPRLTSIEGNMWMPAFREFFLLFGAVSSSRTSLNHLLSNSKGGSAPVLLVGGVPEMENKVPDEVTLVLRKRKGFIKMAMKHGACLVPTFSFGEAGVYKQAGGLVNTMQECVKKFIGIAPVIFVGRGWLQDTFGILPLRKPITVVVGEPIEVEKNENPSNSDIDDLHERYISELQKLYTKYNHEFGDSTVKLIIN